MKHNLIILVIVGMILKLTLGTSSSIFVEYSVLSLLILLLITFIAKKANTQQKWKM